MAFTKKIAGWVAGRIKGEQARKDTMRWMEKTGLGQVLDIAGDIALTQGALKGAGKLKGLLTGGGQAAAPVAAKALPEGVTEVGRMASASPAEARSLTAQMVQPKPLPAPGAGTTTFAPRAATAITPPPAPTGMPGATPMRAMVAPSAGTTTMAPRVAAGVTPSPTAARLPMQTMIAPPTPAPAITPTPAPTGMTPQMTRTAGRMGGMENVTNANVVRSGGFRGFMQGAKEYAPLIQATAMPVANVIGAKIEQDIEEDKIKREQAARNRLAMLLMPMFQAQMGQAAPSFQPRG